MEQSTESNPSTFLRVDEFNESSGQLDGLDLSQQHATQESWIADADELRDAQPPTGDTADTGPPAEARSPGRPPLRRDQWAPAPRQPPPPAPPDAVPEDADVPTDSLSLAQLRRIVQDMPKKEATPYAFEYQDTSSFEEEVEELFDYSVEEREGLAHAQTSFEELWQQWHEDSSSDGVPSWTNSTDDAKADFLTKLKRELLEPRNSRQEQVALALTYLALGCWKEKDGFLEEEEHVNTDSNLEDNQLSGDPTYREFGGHVLTMKANIRLIASRVGLAPIYDTFRSTCSLLVPEDSALNSSTSTSQSIPPSTGGFRSLLTLIYLLFDLARREKRLPMSAVLVADCQELAPQLLRLLTGLLAEMRWNDSSNFPLIKLLPLYWKVLLMTFGGLKDVGAIKRTLDDQVKSTDDESQPHITASPLDYHLFRQEITSKYPAFNPPQPLFPFESESTSMVPPLQERPNLEKSTDGIGPASVNGNGSSIFHQPVHIATPAPSPPPSPAGPGGKGIKKQNYQTNQMFPFLYPPPDDSGDLLAVQGDQAIPDILVGKKWEGRDVPASILEAAEIFASRMKATRAMKQLWDERVQFMKYERGYTNSFNKAPGPEDDTKENRQADEQDSDLEKLTRDQRARLDRVEEFFATELPHLQSAVIVLLKVLLETVTTLVTQPNSNGLQTGFESPEHNSQDMPQTNGDVNDTKQEANSAALENVNKIRSQEILGKSVSGVLLLFLKWFKLSHILKAEFLGQLVLDSNYVQLILKLFTHQELERVVNHKCEDKRYNFFDYCRHLASSASGSPQPDTHEAGPPATEPEEKPQDDAEPPPIADNRQPAEPGPELENLEAHALHAEPPEVDELGYSTSTGPHAPITNFSWRAFFSTINHLRILQKIVKNKPHRQLLMVQYKYSNVLKKSLKVPQPEVRLYTLKVIKGQVPYCHRKWRQSNMRIITAIYLHCKPELRDDWLAGLTMEEEMHEALPQEQALRSLTYWHNLRKYPEVVTDDAEKARGLLEEEQDFFVRELEGIEAAINASVEEGALSAHPESVDPMTGKTNYDEYSKPGQDEEQAWRESWKQSGADDYAAGLERMYGARTQEASRPWRATSN